MAGIAPQLRKTALEPAALEVVLELALDVSRRDRTLRRQVGFERGIIVLDKLV